ncbi:MAG: hypothetical protein M1833_004443 [Piccolia ochrophora]|nr:MAG: hypothetical protein M1833_004443 [Piccolia ochrophora]
MPSAADDLAGEPPSSIDPYLILGLEKEANDDEVKAAYRKAALKHHPDKAAASAKATATLKFQEIAFAYAILSDARRRRRYDATGRTEDSLDLDDDDDFNWSDFFRAQWADVVSGDSLAKFEGEYKRSQQETDDLLAIYVKSEGDLDAVFEQVMLSNPLEDEDRFRVILDDAIKTGEVEAYEAYTTEPMTKRKRRTERAKREEREAMKLAKKLGVEKQMFGKTNKKQTTDASGDEAALLAMIQQRQKGRAEGFLERLEQKYAASGQKKGSKAKKRQRSFEDEDGPPEEAFQRNAAKKSKIHAADEKATEGDAPKAGGRERRTRSSKNSG